MRDEGLEANNETRQSEWTLWDTARTVGGLALGGGAVAAAFESNFLVSAALAAASLVVLSKV